MLGKVKYEVVKDLQECERLWKEFSPNEAVFDVWEYRAAFFDCKHYEPHFIVAKKRGKTVGVLPLWEDFDYRVYEFFGGEVTERNKFFVKDRKLVPDLLKQAPKDTNLWYIEESETAYAPLKKFEDRYALDLKECDRSLEEYFRKNFGSGHRKTIRKKMRRLDRLGLKVKHNDLGDMEALMKLNKARFKRDSFFAPRHFRDGFRKLAEEAKKNGELQMLSIETGGKVVSAEVAILHNGVYTLIFGGNDLEVSNIGHMMTIEHINNAIAQGADVVDFMGTDAGWKKDWKLKQEPVYGYEK